jgi:hypothetical protein
MLAKAALCGPAGSSEWTSAALTHTDVAQRLRAFWEQPWASYPNEQLRVSSRRAHDRRRVIGKHAGHQRQVADVPVDEIRNSAMIAAWLVVIE